LRIVPQNQGLPAIAFFEATACVVLLVLFALLKRDHRASYFRLWLTGWLMLTGSAIADLFNLSVPFEWLSTLSLAFRIAASFAFLSTVLNFRIGTKKRFLAIWPLSVVSILALIYLERSTPASFGTIRWETSILLCILSLASVGSFCTPLPRRMANISSRLCSFLAQFMELTARTGRVARTFSCALPLTTCLAWASAWPWSSWFWKAPARETRNSTQKLRRLTLLTAAGTQTLSAKELLDSVLKHVVESVGASHGIVRLLEGDRNKAKLVIHAAVGFQESYLKQHNSISAEENWAKRVLQKDHQILRIEDEQDEQERRRMAESKVQDIIALPLRGKDGVLGILALGSNGSLRYEADEVAYLTNIANFLGLTLQNVRLFEQVDSVHRQWEYTFDSIGDPILVHDQQFRIVRLNQRLRHLTGRDSAAHAGRSVCDLFPKKNLNFENCPYCEGRAGEGDDPDPWLPGFFLASNSTFSDPSAALSAPCTSSRTSPNENAPRRNTARLSPTCRKASSFQPRRATFSISTKPSFEFAATPPASRFWRWIFRRFTSTRRIASV